MNLVLLYEKLYKGIEIKDFGMAFYYEYFSQNEMCVLPGNGIDFVWNADKESFETIVYANQCTYLNGKHFYGIHLENVWDYKYDITCIEHFFKELKMKEQSQMRCDFVEKNIHFLFEKQPAHPVLNFTIKEITRNKGNFVSEDWEENSKYSYSIRQIQRIFKAVFGYGPKLFSRKERILYIVKHLLIDESINMEELVVWAGFSNRSHFQREFKGFFDMTPKAFLQKINNSNL